MKNKIKNSLLIIILLVIIAGIFPKKIYAAASANISASSTSINVGETTTISINVFKHRNMGIPFEFIRRLTFNNRECRCLW